MVALRARYVAISTSIGWLMLLVVGVGRSCSICWMSGCLCCFVVLVDVCF